MQSISKLKTKKSYKKLAILIAAAIVLLAAGAYVALARPFNSQQVTDSPTNGTTRPVNSVDYNPPTAQDKQDSQDAKQRDINQQQQNNPPTNPSITVTIARAGQTGVGQPVSIRTIIGGITTGSCNATVTSNGQTVTGNGTVMLTGTSYACNIDIPASSFTANGQWQLHVTATNGSATSPAATQTITVNK